MARVRISPRRGAALFVFLVILAARTATAQCCGDCNGDGQVAVNELVVGVKNAIDGCSGVPCCGDCSATGTVTITDLVTAVDDALLSCVAALPTATPSAPTSTSTLTATPEVTATATLAATPTATLEEPRCAAGETEFTFVVAASEDDGAVTAFARAPYPPGNPDAQNDQAAGSPYRSKLATNFSIQVNLFRWQTSFFPGGAVTRVYFRFYTPDFLINIDEDGRSLTADWYDWSDNGGVDTADYALAAQTNALAGLPIGELGGSGEWSLVRLDNADGVDMDGTTYLRLHVSGDEPSAINGVGIEHWDDSRDHPAELIVCQAPAALPAR